ncbi:MAG: hypothetical protein WCA91_09495 [Candidatus Acidiferrales bacterium]
MQTPSASVDHLYPIDWIGIAMLAIFYAATVILLRWRPRTPTVTRYDPPDGISPALAGYLHGNGDCETAFAAALVSLASKGYLRIQQIKDWFTLERLRQADCSLPPEESTILATLFYPAGIHTYKFNSRECSRLAQTYKKFIKSMEGIAEPELMSAHSFVWFSGIVYAVAAVAYLFHSVRIFSEMASLGSVLFLGFFIALGVSSFAAAVRSWPPTVSKLASIFRRDGRPRRGLDAADIPPIIFTASSLLAFGFLAALTSIRLAVLLTGLSASIIVFRTLLEAPTSTGRAALAKLDGFREFLARADADRLNRENEPGLTPQTLEKYTAYAVALDVEHAWGEEFTENLLEILQFDLAYSRGEGMLTGVPELLSPTREEIGDDAIQLDIERPRGRTKSRS